MSYELIKLGDVCKITSGGTPSRKKNEYYNGGNIPWIKTGDLKQKYISIPEEYITETGLKSSSAKLFPQKTVLIALYGATIGNCGILDIDAATNQACGAFLPSEKIIPEYLYYFLFANKPNFISQGVGGAQPNISGGILKNTKISLPPLETQKQIIAILDKAQSLIDQRKEQIKEMDNLVQSLFYDMFGDPATNPMGWEVKKLKDLVRPDTKISYGIVQPGDDFKDGISIIRPVDLKVRPVQLTNLKKTDPIISSKYSKTILEGNELLISVRGSTGDTLVTSIEYIGMNITRGLAIIRPMNVNLLFLNGYLNTEHSQRYISDHTKGATLKQINMNDLRAMDILYPTMELQNTFADRVQSIEQKKEYMTSSLKELQDNFNCLIQKAFKGELV